MEISWECDVQQEHVPHQLQHKDHTPQIEEVDVEDHQKNEVDYELALQELGYAKAKLLHPFQGFVLHLCCHLLLNLVVVHHAPRNVLLFNIHQQFRIVVIKYCGVEYLSVELDGQIVVSTHMCWLIELELDVKVVFVQMCV